MARAIAVCEECGKEFHLVDEEIQVPPFIMLNVVPNRRPYLTSWADWIEHVTSHCKNCRIMTPPQSCMNDYLKKEARWNASHS